MLLKDAADRGEAVFIPGIGHFLVRLHLCPDLKAMKAMLGLRSGPCTDPCPLCTINGKQECMGQLNTVWPPHENAVERSVLGIPLDRVHPCTLHALCRFVYFVIKV